MKHNPKSLCHATACEQQWLYQIGEEGIVYSEKQNRIAGLDAAGVLAYQAFDAGASLHDLEGLSGTGQTSLATVQALDTIFALSKGRFPKTQSNGEHIDWPTLSTPRNANIKICDIPVLLECPYKTLEMLSRDCFLSCPSTSWPARFHLRVEQRAQSSWAILLNEQEVFSNVADGQIGLGMLHAVRSFLYDAAPYDVAFHAAMVSDNEHGIMLCAPREFGKSTLAAYLAAHGFAVVSDEPALLNLNTAMVAPVEMAISLKEGTWQILEKDWPQLLNAPVHVRSDGCRIKLLHTQQECAVRVAHPLTHIVFPKYSPSLPARFEALSPMHGLALLNEGGMLLGKQMNKDKFERFLDWIFATPTYFAQYSSLEQAEEMLKSVLTICGAQPVNAPEVQ